MYTRKRSDVQQICCWYSFLNSPIFWHSHISLCLYSELQYSVCCLDMSLSKKKGTLRHTNCTLIAHCWHTDGTHWHLGCSGLLLQDNGCEAWELRAACNLPHLPGPRQRPRQRPHQRPCQHQCRRQRSVFSEHCSRQHPLFSSSHCSIAQLSIDHWFILFFKNTCHL